MRSSISVMRCRSPSLDVGGPPGMPTAGPMVIGSSRGGETREIRCGATAAAIPARIATAIVRWRARVEDSIYGTS